MTRAVRPAIDWKKDVRLTWVWLHLETWSRRLWRSRTGERRTQLCRIESRNWQGFLRMHLGGIQKRLWFVRSALPYRIMKRPWVHWGMLIELSRSRIRLWSTWQSRRNWSWVCRRRLKSTSECLQAKERLICKKLRIWEHSLRRIWSKWKNESRPGRKN